MIFRGRQPEPSVWRRFRSGADNFTFTQESEYFEARVAANAERVVDLLVGLLYLYAPLAGVAEITLDATLLPQVAQVSPPARP